jgi:tetratricopeptide (TPR) repeat protein
LGLAIGLVIFIALALIYYRQKRTLLVSLLTLLIGSGLFLAFYTVQRPDSIQETVALSEVSVSNRFLNWNDSLDLIRSSPLAGTGPGSFYIAFRQYGDAALANSERFDDAHNIFLHLAVSGGIPLALFFAGILLLALGKGWQVVRLKRHPLAISLVAGLVGLIVAMSFNPVVVPCWFLLATLAVGLLVLSPDKQVAMSRLARYGFLVVAVLLIIYAFASLLNEHFTRNAIVAYRARDFARVERNSKLAGYFNPFGVTARSYWAMSAVQLGREPQQTERIIRYSLKLHPNSSADHQVAATVYYYLYRQTGDRKYLESMDKEIDRALSLEPRYAKLLGQAAYLYFKSEQLNKAIALQRNSLALDNTNFYSWLLLAKLYALTGQKQPAIAALEEASMLQPEVLLLKRLRDDLQQQPDPRSVYFPIQFPEPAI